MPELLIFFVIGPFPITCLLKLKKYSSSYLNIFIYLNRDLEGAYVFLKGTFGPTFRTIKTFGSLWILLSSESFWSLGTDCWFSVWSEWILPFAYWHSPKLSYPMANRSYTWRLRRSLNEFFSNVVIIAQYLP